jgi:hypothetical protein
MGYDRIYGPVVPCACGRGLAMPYRLQDDQLPSHAGPFDEGVEIDCLTCDPGLQTWAPAERAIRLRTRPTRGMSRVQRHHTCPVCGLRFLVVFDGSDHLGEVAVRIDCPRAPGGGERQIGDPAAGCQGYLVTHVPTQYRVLASRD